MTGPESTIVPVWARKHLVALGTVDLLAMGTIAGAWVAASGTRQAGVQGRWLALAVVGLAVSALANGGWILLGRQRVGLRAGGLPSVAAGRHPGVRRLSGVGSARDAALVAAPDATLFHRPACPFASGAVAAAGRSEHERMRRQPCGVCEP